MKKLIKVLSLVLVLVMVVAPVVSFANNDFSKYANKNGDIGGIGEDIGTLGSGVYGVLRTIGLIVAVCMIVYMGIQWILATPAKKAELKGRMWSMAIGVVLLIGGVAVLGMIQTAVEQTEIVNKYQGL